MDSELLQRRQRCLTRSLESVPVILEKCRADSAEPVSLGGGGRLRGTERHLRKGPRPGDRGTDRVATQGGGRRTACAQRTHLPTPHARVVLRRKAESLRRRHELCCLCPRPHGALGASRRCRDHPGPHGYRRSWPEGRPHRFRPPPVGPVYRAQGLWGRPLPAAQRRVRAVDRPQRENGLPPCH